MSKLLEVMSLNAFTTQLGSNMKPSVISDMMREGRN